MIFVLGKHGMKFRQNEVINEMLKYSRYNEITIGVKEGRRPIKMDRTVSKDDREVSSTLRVYLVSCLRFFGKGMPRKNGNLENKRAMSR